MEVQVSPASDSDEYTGKTLQNRRKRRKTNVMEAKPFLVSALNPFAELRNDGKAVESFEDVMNQLLPDLLRSRATLQDNLTEVDDSGNKVRPLTRSEVSIAVNRSTPRVNPISNITLRKLKVVREKRRSYLLVHDLQASDLITPYRPPPSNFLPPNPQVLSSLYSIKTTSFENSFLSRLRGTLTSSASTVAVDWETRTPWMILMGDIREHYCLSHPERDKPTITSVPITYTFLQALHLEQVHNLLERVFWNGISVRDSLEHSPERCTLVAMYRKLVVGIAILSSPRETYITYLAVRAGWDNAGIARSLLYHLIKLNPHQDITLHVSVNNPAMLLYNQFGFKAEEFVAGFYDAYLDPLSRASKNAFRLRLRQH